MSLCGGDGKQTCKMTLAVIRLGGAGPHLDGSAR